MSLETKTFYRDNISSIINDVNGLSGIPIAHQNSFQNFSLASTFSLINAATSQLSEGFNFLSSKNSSDVIKQIGERFLIVPGASSIFNLNPGDFLSSLSDVLNNPLDFIKNNIDLKKIAFEGLAHINPNAFYNLGGLPSLSDFHISDIEGTLREASSGLLKKVTGYANEHGFDLSQFVSPDTILDKVSTGNVESLFNDALQPITSYMKNIQGIGDSKSVLLILNSLNKSKQPSELLDVFARGEAVQFGLKGIDAATIINTLEQQILPNLRGIGAYGAYENGSILITRPFETSSGQIVSNKKITTLINPRKSLTIL